MERNYSVKEPSFFQAILFSRRKKPLYWILSKLLTEQ